MFIMGIQLFFWFKIREYTNNIIKIFKEYRSKVLISINYNSALDDPRVISNKWFVNKKNKNKNIWFAQQILLFILNTFLRFHY